MIAILVNLLVMASLIYGVGFVANLTTG
jgi:hypothetical protein